MQLKLFLVTLFERHIACISVRKPSERLFGFVKTESEPNFGFPHIPSYVQWRF